MTRAVRIEAARLAVGAAGAIDDEVDATTIFSLAIFFENWIMLGGDETQRRMKLLPENEGAKVLQLVRDA